MSLLLQFDREQERDLPQAGEQGFMLLAVVLMVFFVLMALAVAAPVITRQLRRDKEIESQHRMEQYVRAIQLYQRKLQSYPPSIKALENTNNIRFLRHVYVDPLTGKKDYRLIHQGEQKTKIHVFFGKTLDEISGGGLGAASGMQSAGGMGTPMGGGTSVTSTSPLSAGLGGATIGGTGSTGATGTGGTSDFGTGFGGSTTGTSGTSGTSGASGSDSTGMFGDGTGGVIVGVGTAKSGDSVTDPNGQKTYQTWEFWYDPRIEQLRQGVSLTGGGMSSQSASSFGQNGVTGQSNSGASGTSGNSFGSSSGSNGFGSSSGSGFGSSGFGSSGSGSTGNGSSGTGTSGNSGSTPPSSSPF